MGINDIKQMMNERGTLTHKEWFAKHGVPAFPKSGAKKAVASKMPVCKGGNCSNKAHKHA